MMSKLFVLFALIVWLVPTLAGRVVAQNFATLYSFTNSNYGADPLGGVIQSDNVLYGTTCFGGDGIGNIFRMNTDGTQFTNLYSFTPDSGSFPAPITNADGTLPNTSLLLSGSILYGAAADGGISGGGTVFKINIGGDGFSVLHSFAFSDGGQPRNGLVMSGNRLYGTARNGGGSKWGTVFAVNTDSKEFTNLYNFTDGNDGGQPEAGLLLSGSTLYGTTSSGGSRVTNNPQSGGTVFEISTDGTGFTNLYSFTGGSDGNNPQSVLVLSSNRLIGTTVGGGSSGLGTVFALNIDGSGFTNLYSFTGGNDGANPQAGLILWRNTLYGTATQGGSFSNGTVFAINTDGTEFTILHSFSAASGSTTHVTNSDGVFPSTGLTLSGNILYGTAVGGGESGLGTVFNLSLPTLAPELSIVQSGTNVILTWPTNTAGFTLQSTADLASSALWNTVLTEPTIVNGQNTVAVSSTINPASGTKVFFRLSQ